MLDPSTACRPPQREGARRRATQEDLLALAPVRSRQVRRATVLEVRLDQLELVAEPNDAARQLARAFWPGPLTMVLPKKPVVPDIVTAGRDSVAVRMPSHRLFRRLLKLAGVPLAVPSATPARTASQVAAVPTVTSANQVKRSSRSRLRAAAGSSLTTAHQAIG